MVLEPHSKLVFIGDSITDCGRARPVGEGLFNALGNGYVSLVDARLTAEWPEHRIRVVNVGSGGNTVRDLAARWQQDVLDLNPDYLSIMIGINDVWRQFDTPLISDGHVLISEYEATLERLIVETKPTLKRLILATPFYIEPNRADAMRAMMDAYGAVVKKLAAQYGAILVDTQAALDRHLQFYHPNSLAWDRVHPNLTGSLLIANAFVDALHHSN